MPFKSSEVSLPSTGRIKVSVQQPTWKPKLLLVLYTNSSLLVSKIVPETLRSKTGRSERGYLAPSLAKLTRDFGLWTKQGPEDKLKERTGKVAPCKYWSG